ncbi:MAG: phosphatase PAP2 family protein [Patescibacteria group bacterium]
MDQALLLAVQSIQHSVLDVTSQVISRFVANGFVWLLVIGALFLERRRLLHQASIALATGFILELGIVEGFIKPLVARSRPFWVLPDIRVIDGVTNTYSFPSGHVALLTVAGWILSHYFPKTAWVWVVLVGLTVWSRVYNGVHYPSDVLAGVLIGSLIGWLTLRVIPRLQK